MADLADITADRDEREHDARMAACKKPTGPVANGSCHYCGERIPEPMRFCDADCSTGWNEEQRLRALRGR